MGQFLTHSPLQGVCKAPVQGAARDVTLRKDAAGSFTVAARELVAVRLNPWWFPSDLYAPGKPERGGPFTIGRVVPSGRSIGFIGHLGGVAVFNRALAAEEMVRLSDLGRDRPIFAP